MEERVGVRSVTFHFILFIINIVGVYWDLTYGNTPSFERFAGRARYLTHLTEFMSFAYTGFAFFADVQHLLRGKKDDFIISLRDFLYTAVISPATLFVPAMFWLIAYYDVNGLLSPEHAKIVPLSGVVNNFVHTWPLVFNLMCTLIVYHEHPNRRTGALTASGVVFTYIVWLLFIRYYDGVWSYPFLGNFSPPGLALYLGSVIVIFGALYVVSEKIAEYRWGHLKEKRT